MQAEAVTFFPLAGTEAVRRWAVATLAIAAAAVVSVIGKDAALGAAVVAAYLLGRLARPRPPVSSGRQ